MNVEINLLTRLEKNRNVMQVVNIRLTNRVLCVVRPPLGLVGPLRVEDVRSWVGALVSSGPGVWVSRVDPVPEVLLLFLPVVTRAESLLTPVTRSLRLRGVCCLSQLLRPHCG